MQIARTGAEQARRHAVHADCKHGERAADAPTLGTWSTWCRAPPVAVDSMGSSSFVSDCMMRCCSWRRCSASWPLAMVLTVLASMCLIGGERTCQVGSHCKYGVSICWMPAAQYPDPDASLYPFPVMSSTESKGFLCHHPHMIQYTSQIFCTTLTQKTQITVFPAMHRIGQTTSGMSVKERV